MSNVIDRFLEYVKVDTRSVEPKPGEECSHPSSEGQLVLAGMLQEELTKLGYEIRKFEDGSFLVHLTATDSEFENAPHVVLAAHLDTYYGFPGKANPQRVVYKGGDLVVNADKDVVIKASSLNGLEGQEIITTDGTSVLGADDKAGVAVMMELLVGIQNEKIDHGPLTFWFCVDEEIGELDINVIPKEIVESWDILWTVDGERFGDLDVGCFTGLKFEAIFEGKDAHPGVYPDALKPAIYAAIQFAHMVTSGTPSPMDTAGMESFYYITHIEGDASKSSVTCMPRTFDPDESVQMVEVLKTLARLAAKKFGVKVEINDEVLYHNTRPAIEKQEHLLLPAIESFKTILDINPRMEDVRGGTDGAMVNMTYSDLPAPNLGTGCCNLHSPTEFLVVKELELLERLLIDMIKRYKDTTI